MIIRVGGCYGSQAPGYRSVGFLINDRLLLEGGTVTSAFDLSQQESVTDILISHIHLDHTKELFFFLDNRAQMKSPTVTLCGSRDVIDGAHRYLFNHQIWPDFSQLSNAGHPFLAFRSLEEGAFSDVGGIRVKPVPVSHPVPATGFILRDAERSVVYTGDTGPTEAIWQEARREKDIAAVIVETSFPNDMEDIAIASGHLTPALLSGELEKLDRPDIPVFVFHVKPMYLDTITKELDRTGRQGIEIMRDGESYEF